MKIISINLCNTSSTGKIARNIGIEAEKQGIKYYNAYPWYPTNQEKRKNDIIIGNKIGKKMSILLGRMTGFLDCFSFFATINFIYKINKIKPDIIHFHNLHGGYLNLPILFYYIKKKNYKIVWTLHDCWPFTGKCPYFDSIECNKWKEQGCCNCPQLKEYPKIWIDSSKILYSLKKKWFLGIKKLTIVTPSKWLANLVKDSFLKNYYTIVINNGIDLDAFKFTKSNFRKKHNLMGKYIVLGVASPWCRRKGLDIFIKLAKSLDEKYQIILVGTEDSIDKQLPSNIISIHRTNNQVELAKIYSAADLFVNPTREDNYPTVNMEAIACGTPVLTFDTGGSKEMLDKTCGDSVKCDDLSLLIKKIKLICETKKINSSACITKAKEYDMKLKFKEYVNLYNKINNDQ